MKDEQLDNIMLKYIHNKENPINIEGIVMNRIKEYENKRLTRLLYIEYVLFGIILFTGIISIFIIQYLFDIYSYIYEYFWTTDPSIAVWLSMGLYILIIISAIGTVFYLAIFKKQKKTALTT